MTLPYKIGLLLENIAHRADPTVTFHNYDGFSATSVRRFIQMNRKGPKVMKK